MVGNPISMISFVVPAYNEEKYLGATLESIRGAMKSVGEPYEIVVANDASTDATAAIAEQGGARVVTVEKRQISATRNAGAKAARGEYLIFVDADTQVDAPVVAAALAAMKGGAAGGGAAVRFEPSAPRWAKAIIAVTIVLFRVAKLAAGCFVFATRTAFDAVGGFDERYFGAEEIVISRALKGQGRFVVLREAVTTSARKAYTHSIWDMVILVGRLALRGPSVIRQRRGMDFWYDDRR
jgi:glycosyltransferase involved in cell wall biosynthesis